MTTFATSVVKGVDPGDAGAASATVNAAQQVGGSLGTALLNTIATTATASYLATRSSSAAAEMTGTVHGFSTALGVATTLLVLTALLTAILVPNRAHWLTRQNAAATDPAQPR